ncbi:MAG: hypothetical protein HYR96_14945 [Deltaproteobacteria bacterium]|nr:hypothetical protein [Deltaproteobacteria bacterium]MBI3293667.1 hypothetical protein [Deltaproteobacteria bacterium]
MKPRNDIRDRAARRIGTLFALFAVAAILATPAKAHDKEEVKALLSHPEMVGVLSAVGEINAAMRSAAENPMDEFRRTRVRKAVANLPNALKTLAGVFQGNGIADAQLPLVQAMLGGYIDVNAADNYNKFLNHPSAALIPKMGSNFPKKYLVTSTHGSAATQSLVMDENAPKGQTDQQIASEIANIEAGLSAKAQKLNPQYFNTIPMNVMLSLLTGPDVHAEGGGQPDNEKTGNKGAEFLMGMAMMMAAASPMVAAAVQADADKQIAKTNQQTALATSQISADTSKYLAETQKSITDQQIATTQQIAKMNNDATTQRLNAQLAELGKAREENNQLSREKRDMEYGMNQQRMALAQKQADDNVQLAKATLSAQVAQAGLAQGLATNPGNQLVVNRGAGNSMFPGATSATGALVPRTGVNPMAGNVGAQTLAQGGQLPFANRAAASSQLLSTLRVTPITGVPQQQLLMNGGAKKAGTVRGARASISARANGSPKMSRELAANMASNLDVIGSAPGRMAGSDLARFQAQVSATGETFATARARAVTSVPGAVRHLQPSPTVAAQPGYNPPPALVIEGSTHSVTSGARGFFNMPTR